MKITDNKFTNLGRKYSLFQLSSDRQVSQFIEELRNDIKEIFDLLRILEEDVQEYQELLKMLFPLMMDILSKPSINECLKNQLRAIIPAKRMIEMLHLSDNFLKAYRSIKMEERKNDRTE